MAVRRQVLVSSDEVCSAHGDLTQQRDQITKIALARPSDHGLPFSMWSLSGLADYLVAQGVVEDISHEGLRVLLREVRDRRRQDDPRRRRRLPDSALAPPPAG